MSQRLHGVREASLSYWLALTPFILQKSRMRKRACTDLCGGRSAMGVPTATVSGRYYRVAGNTLTGPARQVRWSRIAVQLVSFTVGLE
jgi:hypothetical protein